MSTTSENDGGREPGRSTTPAGGQASVVGPPLPAPSLDGVAEAVERDRVFAALFQVPAERQRLGSYVVLGTLGRGAMGTVLEAFDRTLDRRVAVKVLHRELGPRHRARLVREAQALARLSHPNVVQVYEVGEAEGQVFIAMELVRGRSLAEWLEQEPRPGWRERVQVLVQAGEGLAAAHAEGLVHRDFKPDNAVIDDKGRVRVLDFGLARQAEDAEQDERTISSEDLGLEEAALASSLTQTGSVLGTPAYMPLEQMSGHRADARSDQFGFCVALYEALYGERPFEGRSLEALAVSLREGRVRPAPKGSAVPEGLRRVVLRGLAAEPEARWPSMDALLAELRRQVAPRRRAWWAFGVAAGLVALGVGLAQYAAVGFRCEGAAARLAGIWDEAREQEVRAAILGTGLSYAPDTWQRVDARLDEYAAAWVAEHTEACEATSVRQEQSSAVMDLRMGCLQDRRVALREAVEVLAHADASRVEHAVALVSDLPELSRCDDVEALRAELPPPEDPAVAERVERERERLALAYTLGIAGEYAEALALAEAVAEEAEALGYPPLLAEAWQRRGRLRADMGEPGAAEQDLERAYYLAVELGHERVESGASTELAFAIGDMQGRFEAARQWARTALALSRSPRVEPMAEGRALHALGQIHLAKHELEEALSRYRESLAAWERALGPDHPMLAHALMSIGRVHHESGELEEALSYYRRALAIQEHAFGPGHPAVAKLLGNIGDVLQRQGALDEAVAHLRRALEVLEQALGPDHPDVAMALDLIGVVRKRQGEADDALEHHRRALAIRERALGPKHPSVAISMSHVAVLLAARGEHDEAEAHHRRSLAIFEAALGPDHFNVGISLDWLGLVLNAQGKLEEAHACHSRALGIIERAMGPTAPQLGPPLLNLADLALARRDHAEARALVERTLAIREASEVSPRELADTRFMLARALELDPAERARARALAEQARDAYAVLGAATQAGAAEVEAWLAEHPAP